jgi:hypothetical protein
MSSPQLVSVSAAVCTHVAQYCIILSLSTIALPLLLLLSRQSAHTTNGKNVIGTVKAYASM